MRVVRVVRYTSDERRKRRDNWFERAKENFRRRGFWFSRLRAKERVERVRKELERQFNL